VSNNSSYYQLNTRFTFSLFIKCKLTERLPFPPALNTKIIFEKLVKMFFITQNLYNSSVVILYIFNMVQKSICIRGVNSSSQKL